MRKTPERRRAGAWTTEQISPDYDLSCDSYRYGRLVFARGNGTGLPVVAALPGLE